MSKAAIAVRTDRVVRAVCANCADRADRVQRASTRGRGARTGFAAAALALAAALGATAFTPARAQLFGGDDEARRAIIDLRGRVEVQNRETSRQLEALAAKIEERTTALAARLDRLEQTARGQLELHSQIEALRQEIARLRGQLEVQANDVAQMQRQQREQIAALDARLKPFEPVQVELDGKTVSVEPEERRTYEDALAQFRSGQFAAAITGFQRLASRWPATPYLPHALYWSGSAQFALKDYKAAIATQQTLLERFPDHPRAPDAMLAVGVAQTDSGDRRAARKTLETLVEKHANAPAAQIARERLPALR